MSADPKADLIHAILALDAYNRGYGFGITGLDAPKFGSDGNPLSDVRIGEYSIYRQSNTAAGSDAFNAGFYAIAYRNTATHEVVISYRGTDFNGNWPSLGDVSRASCTHHSSS